MVRKRKKIGAGKSAALWGVFNSLSEGTLIDNEAKWLLVCELKIQLRAPESGSSGIHLLVLSVE